MNKLHYFMILLAAALWGSIGLFFHHLSDQGLNRFQIVAIRVNIAMFCLGLYLLWKDRRLFHIHWRDLWMFAGTGLCSLLFFNYCYFTTMQLTSLSVAAVLLYTAPIFVMLMSVVLFHEALTIRKILVAAMTFLGCVLVAGLFGGDAQAVTTKGLLFGLGAGFGYALYSIFGTYALRKYDSMTITFYTFLLAGIGILPLCSIDELAPLLSDGTTIVYSLGLGIFACMLPYIFYTKGLSGVPASQASVIATVEPVVAALISVFVFGEVLTLDKLFGMLLILAAIVVLNIQRRNVHG